MNKSVLAYLDILGFSNHVREYPDLASNLLKDYSSVIGNNGFGGRYNSFNDFLPFSDSIFIKSDNPSEFVIHLSEFLIKSFLRNGFGNMVVKRGTSDSPPVISPSDFVAKPPLLFRGGVAYGDSDDLKLTDVAYIRNSKLGYSNILIGKLVIEAVVLEKIGKGPRIFCSREFYESLNDDCKKMVVKQFDDEDGKSYEILWPAGCFKKDVNFDHLNYEFDRLLISAAISWKYFNHKQIGIHYYNFLKLVVISVLHYWKESHYKEASEFVKGYLTRRGLQDKIEDLMQI